MLTETNEVERHRMIGARLINRRLQLERQQQLVHENSDKIPTAIITDLDFETRVVDTALSFLPGRARTLGIEIERETYHNLTVFERVLKETQYCETIANSSLDIDNQVA